MANTKHFNNIKIARGTRAKWLAGAKPSYGEMFYDKNTKGVYIAIPNADAENGIELKRFGGFDSVVLKGTIFARNFANICRIAEPGDAYIVTGRISVEQPEVTFDNEGDVKRNATSVRTYDNYFKNGQVIIFTSEDVSSIPNSYIFNDSEIAANPEGVKGIITLAGTAEAVDLEYDPSLTEVASDKGMGTGKAITDVQTALDTLFNEKMEYIGSFNEITITATDNLTEADNYTPATAADKAWAIIAKQKQLHMGQSLVYSGPTTKVTTVDGDVTIRTNTMIVNNAGTIYTIPLGASEARDIAYTPAGDLKTDESVPSFTTVQSDGTKVTLTEDQIATVQHALDYLHQNKADLNSNGKLPLSQMPSTMIGALQYVGTVQIGNNVTSLTVAELAALMRTAKEGSDSWETDTDSKTGNKKAKAYENLDSGDYVIISIPLSPEGETTDKDLPSQPDEADEDHPRPRPRPLPPDEADEDHPLSRQISILDGKTELFKISNGDHVIVNKADEDGYTFDHLDTSAAVDAINEIIGSVNIVDQERVVTKGFYTDGTKVTDEIQETKVTTTPADHTIRVESPNGVLEYSDIAAHNIPQAGGSRSLVASDLSINDVQHNSNYHKGDDKTHNTELIGKKKDGTSVTVEFPNKDGMIQVISEGDGTKDVLPKFNEEGTLIDSEVSQTKDATTENGTLHLGKNFDINYDELAKLLQYLRGAVKITRLFDHDDANINSESQTARTHDENTLVVLDEDSAIDGGEWE